MGSSVTKAASRTAPSSRAAGSRQRSGLRAPTLVACLPRVVCSLLILVGSAILSVATEATEVSAPASATLGGLVGSAPSTIPRHLIPDTDAQPCAALFDLPGQNFETRDCVLHIPAGCVATTAYPLIVAFSPSGNAAAMVRLWQKHAEKHHCLVLASKLVRNGVDVPPILWRLRELIAQLGRRFPIAVDRIIATGPSGGGQTAHLFAFFHPQMVAAVMANIGFIHERSINQPAKYPRHKVAVLMTGPDDYNYKYICEDRAFLDRMGWRTRLLEYPGGHITAPDAINAAALDWVMQQPPFVASSPAR